MWHGNPKIYLAEDIMPFGKKPYKDIWESDKLKKDIIEKQGYKLMYIWEYDYIKDPEGQINKCLEFLTNDD